MAGPWTRDCKWLTPQPPSLVFRGPSFKERSLVLSKSMPWKRQGRMLSSQEGVGACGGGESKASWESALGKARGPPDTGNSMWKGVEAQRAAILLVRQEHGQLMGTWGKEGRDTSPGNV